MKLSCPPLRFLQMDRQLELSLLLKSLDFNCDISMGKETYVEKKITSNNYYFKNLCYLVTKTSLKIESEAFQWLGSLT